MGSLVRTESDLSPVRGRAASDLSTGAAAQLDRGLDLGIGAAKAVRAIAVVINRVGVGMAAAIVVRHESATVGACHPPITHHLRRIDFVGGTSLVVDQLAVGSVKLLPFHRHTHGIASQQGGERWLIDASSATPRQHTW